MTVRFNVMSNKPQQQPLDSKFGKELMTKKSDFSSWAGWDTKHPLGRGDTKKNRIVHMI
jgi:hypothetical protein